MEDLFSISVLFDNFEKVIGGNLFEWWKWEMIEVK